MRFKIIIMTLLGLLVYQEVLFAQSYFKDFLNDQGLSFKKPKGYKLVGDKDSDPVFDFYCFIKGKKDLVSGDFYLHNRDRSVIIMIEDEGYVEMSGPLTPYWYDDNRSIFLNAIGRADTTRYPLVFYRSEELKVLNADGAAELTRNCDVPGNVEGYASNRSIYISKTGQGSFNLVYLFKDTSLVNQNKIIQETKTMLTYTVNKKKSVDITKVLEEHYVTLDTTNRLRPIKEPWNRGSVYKNLYYFNREQYACSYGDISISIQFPINYTWPYFNKTSVEIPPLFAPNLSSQNALREPVKDKWQRANEDFKKYLLLAKSTPTKIPIEKLAKLNADQGYIFDFEHPAKDLYRDKYAKCRVVLLHRNFLGTVLLKYYYHGSEEKVNQAIQQTWGFLKFRELDFFSKNSSAIFPF